MFTSTSAVDYDDYFGKLKMDSIKYPSDTTHV